MKCPECGQNNPADAAICHHCDHIMDDSFLGESGADQDALETLKLDSEFPDEKTPTDSFDNMQAPSESEALDTWRTPLVEETINMEPVGDDASAPPASGSGPDDVERERSRLKAQRKLRTGAATSSATSSAPQVNELDRVSQDVQGMFRTVLTFYRNLHPQDKGTAFASLIMIVTCFMPWVEVTGQGIYIGLEKDAWLVLLLVAGMVSVVVLRYDKDWRSRRKVLLLVQTGMVSILLLFFLAEMAGMRPVTMVTEQMEGTEMVQELASEAQFGLVAGFLACILAAGGTALRLKSVLDQEARGA